MSGRRRKYSENSVIASIGQIQEMLAEERRPSSAPRDTVVRHSLAPEDAPPPPDEQAPPVALPISPGDLAVPSWEEVQNNRAARWTNESQDAMVVRSVSFWRIWRRRIAYSAAVLALVGGTVAVMWLLRPNLPEATPMALPYTRAMHAAELAAQSHAAQTALDGLKAEVSTLKTERATLQARLTEAETAAAKAVATETSEPAPKVKSKRKRRTKAKRTRRVVKRRRARTPRKRRTPRTRTDKNLEGLLNSL